MLQWHWVKQLWLRAIYTQALRYVGVLKEDFGDFYNIRWPRNVQKSHIYHNGIFFVLHCIMFFVIGMNLLLSWMKWRDETIWLCFPVRWHLSLSLCFWTYQKTSLMRFCTADIYHNSYTFSIIYAEIKLNDLRCKQNTSVTFYRICCHSKYICFQWFRKYLSWGKYLVHMHAHTYTWSWKK